MRQDNIPRQNHSLYETRWYLPSRPRPGDRDELRQLLDRTLDEYEAMEWLVRQLIELLAQHTSPGQDPLVDRLLQAYAGPNNN
jgi:hypothetical protein